MQQTQSQVNALLAHFKSGKTLTALEAYRHPFYITQFHVRMKELKEREGLEFSAVWENNPNTSSRYKRYSLVNVNVEVAV